MKGNSYVSLLLWSSLCPTCAAALTFRNFSPSPLLSKSTGQGVSSVVAALCSAGNKTGSLTRGCIGCNTQQSIVGKTQRVPNVAVLTPQWYFDGAGKRGRAQAWVQLYPHPAAHQGLLTKRPPAITSFLHNTQRVSHCPLHWQPWTCMARSRGRLCACLDHVSLQGCPRHTAQLPEEQDQD